MTRRRPPIRALVVALALPLVGVGGVALGGCKASPAGEDASAASGDAQPVAPDPGPIVLGPVGGGGAGNSSRRRPVSEDDDAFWQEKFDTAHAHEQAGEDEIALQLITAAERLGPRKPWDGRFRALRAAIKSRHLAVDVARVDARGEKDYVAFGEDVDFWIRIRNVGTADLVIRGPGPAPGASPTGDFETSAPALALSMRRRDRDIYAAELVRTWTRTVTLIPQGGEDIRIPPEGVHELRVRIPAEDAGGPISGVRVLEVGGDLRAARVEAGIEEPFGRIPIRTGRVVAAPGNFEPLAADPLASMRKAVTVTAPVHLLVAAEFLPPRDRVAAVTLLAEVLATGGEELRPASLNALGLIRDAAAGTPLVPLGEPLMAAMRAHPERAADVGEGLSVLGGVSFPGDVRLWEDWWRRQKAATATVGAPSDAGAKGTR